MLLPLPRRSDWRHFDAHPFSRICLPRNGHRVGLRIDLFEACSAFTHYKGFPVCQAKLDPDESRSDSSIVVQTSSFTAAGDVVRR